MLANGASVVIREFAKKGIPLTCRAAAWKSMLNVSVDDIVRDVVLYIAFSTILGNLIERIFYLT